MSRTRESFVYCGGLDRPCSRDGDCGRCLQEDTPESDQAVIGFVKAAGEDPAGRTFVDQKTSAGSDAFIYKYVGDESDPTKEELEILVSQGRIISKKRTRK